jgi:hypothetical protein
MTLYIPLPASTIHIVGVDGLVSFSGRAAFDAQFKDGEVATICTSVQVTADSAGSPFMEGMVLGHVEVLRTFAGDWAFWSDDSPACVTTDFPDWERVAIGAGVPVDVFDFWKSTVFVRRSL